MKENEFEEIGENKRLEKKRKIKEFVRRDKKLEQFSRFLTGEEKEKIEKNEIEKTKEQKNIIKGVNRIIEKISNDYNLDLYGISEKDIHILPEDIYGEITKRDKRKSRAFSIFEEQKFFVNDSILERKVFFAHSILHEIGHLNGVFQCEENEDCYIYREGLDIYFYSKKDKNIYHYGRNYEEAIVSYLTKKYIPNILKLPEFKKEKEFSKTKEFIKLKKEICKKYNILDDEIIWIDEKGGIDFDIKGEQLIDFKFIIEEIQRKLSGYENEDQVFKEFLKAQSKFDSKDKYFSKIIELVDKAFRDGGTFESLLILNNPEYNLNDNHQLLRDFIEEKEENKGI